MAIQITIPTPKIKLPKLRGRPKISRRKRALITMITVAVIGGGCWFLYQRAMSGPAVGTVMMTAEQTQPKPQPALEQFDGKLFSFVHAMSYVEQNTKPQPGSTELESHAFVSTSMNGGYLSAYVTNLPSGNLADDSSYGARTQDTKKYKKKVLVVKNEPVTVFTSDDGQQLQQAAFWPHDGKLLTFVMTGISVDGQSSVDEFTRMVQSLTWH